TLQEGGCVQRHKLMVDGALDCAVLFHDHFGEESWRQLCKRSEGSELLFCAFVSWSSDDDMEKAATKEVLKQVTEFGQKVFEGTKVVVVAVPSLAFKSLANLFNFDVIGTQDQEEEIKMGADHTNFEGRDENKGDQAKGEGEKPAAKGKEKSKAKPKPEEPEEPEPSAEDTDTDEEEEAAPQLTVKANQNTKNVSAVVAVKCWNHKVIAKNPVLNDVAHAQMSALIGIDFVCLAVKPEGQLGLSLHAGTCVAGGMPFASGRTWQDCSQRKNGQDVVVQGAAAALAAATAYAASKAAYLNTAHLCSQQGVQFVPLVAESTGAWERAASQLLLQIACSAAARTGDDSATLHSDLLQELSVIIRSHRARAVLRRRAELVG
ncbi:unnamed protein product, partial [Durusdinium trenchii]